MAEWSTHPCREEVLYRKIFEVLKGFQRCIFILERYQDEFSFLISCESLTVLWNCMLHLVVCVCLLYLAIPKCLLSDGSQCIREDIWRLEMVVAGDTISDFCTMCLDFSKHMNKHICSTASEGTNMILCRSVRSQDIPSSVKRSLVVVLLRVYQRRSENILLDINLIYE